MTDNEINVAIAEACGIPAAQISAWLEQVEATKAMQCAEQGGEAAYHDKVLCAPDMAPPNYANDLNAMHKIEEESYKEGILAETFAANLQKIVPRRQTEGSSHLRSTNARLFELVNSSARQRAEAFLRTIGKWKD